MNAPNLLAGAGLTCILMGLLVLLGAPLGVLILALGVGLIFTAGGQA